MPVTLYALFRRACNATFKPDAAPLADRKGEIAAVQRAVRLARTGNWGGAAFTLYSAGDKIVGNHGSAVVAREAVGRLQWLASAARDVAWLSSNKDRDVSQMAAVVRDDITAANALIDALEDAGLTHWRERIQTVIDVYKELFR